MSCPRRIVEDGTYHIMSRIAHRSFYLTDYERTSLLGIVKRSAIFCGIELYAYAIMSNHFHLLVHVPSSYELSDEEIIRRYAAWKGKKAADALKSNLTPQLRDKLLKRMFDLSKFMQLLKEWYTTSYNQRTGHTGTLWEAKFKSVLVEPETEALSNITAYIDLNPVRAGMVDDASDYPWSSYGELCRERIFAQSKYPLIYRMNTLNETIEVHKQVLNMLKRRCDELEAPRKADGRLKQEDHMRIRAFTDGVVVGSEQFVEKYFNSHRDDFPAGRKNGAKPIVGLPGTLKTIRELR